jgi:beta-xylosidase
MSQSLEKTNTYLNPILPGFNPDPSICFVPGKGYFVSTSTFEYFPGLPIYHSTDLVTWKVSLDMLAYFGSSELAHWSCYQSKISGS